MVYHKRNYFFYYVHNKYSTESTVVLDVNMNDNIGKKNAKQLYRCMESKPPSTHPQNEAKELETNLKCISIKSEKDSNEEFQSFLKSWSMVPADHFPSCLRSVQTDNDSKSVKCQCFEGLGSVM